MNETLHQTSEAISLINDPAIRVLLSVLLLVIVGISFFGYKFISKLLTKVDTKEEELIEAYTLIYTDSKANLELVLAFSSKLEHHIEANHELRQDVKLLTETAHAIKMKIDELKN